MEVEVSVRLVLKIHPSLVLQDDLHAVFPSVQVQNASRAASGLQELVEPLRQRNQSLAMPGPASLPASHCEPCGGQSIEARLRSTSTALRRGLCRKPVSFRSSVASSMRVFCCFGGSHILPRPTEPTAAVGLSSPGTEPREDVKLLEKLKL